MRYVDLAVRRVIETSALALGGLLVLLNVLFAVHTIFVPECSVDIDHADGVLATRVLAGGWAVLGLLLGVVIGTWFVRVDGTGWGRVAVAVALPIAVVALWVGYAGFHTMVLDGLGAGPGISACV